jgi:hypothetical protein
LRKIAADPKHLGAEIGFLGVLERTILPTTARNPGNVGLTTNSRESGECRLGDRFKNSPDKTDGMVASPLVLVLEGKHVGMFRFQKPEVWQPSNAKSSDDEITYNLLNACPCSWKRSISSRFKC